MEKSAFKVLKYLKLIFSGTLFFSSSSVCHRTGAPISGKASFFSNPPRWRTQHSLSCMWRAYVYCPYAAAAQRHHVDAHMHGMHLTTNVHRHTATAAVLNSATSVRLQYYYILRVAGPARLHTDETYNTVCWSVKKYHCYGIFVLLQSSENES